MMKQMVVLCHSFTIRLVASRRLCVFACARACEHITNLGLKNKKLFIFSPLLLLFVIHFITTKSYLFVFEVKQLHLDSNCLYVYYWFSFICHEVNKYPDTLYLSSPCLSHHSPLAPLLLLNMGFSVHWSWFAVLSCLLSLGKLNMFVIYISLHFRFFFLKPQWDTVKTYTSFKKNHIPLLFLFKDHLAMF